MWRVTATDSAGVQRAVNFVEREGEPFSARLAYTLVSNLRAQLGDSVQWPSRLLEGELGGEDGVPGRDAIASWNEQVTREPFAISDEREERRVQWIAERDGLCLLAAPRFSGERPEVSFAMRHDRTTIVVPLDVNRTSLTLDYRPDETDEEEWCRLARGIGELAVWIEWRAYLGSASGKILGLETTTDIQRIPRPWHRATIETGNAGGFLVGTILRTAGQWASKLEKDPMYEARLDFAESHHHAQRGWPRLKEASLPVDGRLWVLVHGTLSTCYGAFDGLPANFFPADRVFRFEHDTCAEINGNATALCRQLAGVAPDVEIVLMGHSRGGLVARDAGARLREGAPGTSGRPHRNTRVLTFGTPHTGTPLVKGVSAVLSFRLLQLASMAVSSVFPGTIAPKIIRWLAPDAAGQVLSLLARLGASDQFGKSHADATTWACAYAMLRAGRLPDGIYDMREGSSYLGALDQGWDGCRSWGGAFDVNSDPDGFGASASDGFGRAMFKGLDNDLVVSTQSAQAFGAATLVPGCAHTRYFARSDVQTALQRV